MNRVTDQETKDLFASLYASGKTCGQIATETGWSKSHVRKTLVQCGTAIRSRMYTRTHTLTEDWFSCVDTIEKAYWLGFLAADGMNGGDYFRLALKDADRAHVQKFATAVGSDAPIKTIRHKVNGKAYLSAAFTFWSVSMIGDLAKLGITQRKSFTVKPWDGPPELMSHYWRGVFDGDGCLTSTKSTICAILVGNQYMMSAFARFINDRLGLALRVEKHKSIFAVRAHRLSSVQGLVTLLYGESAENQPSLDRKSLLAGILQQRKLFPNHAQPRSPSS